MKKFISSLLTLALLSSLTVITSANEAKVPDAKAASIFYEHEPNNNAASANPYAIEGQINGDLLDSNRMDYFVFYPTKTGTVRFDFAFARGNKSSGDYQDFFLTIKNADKPYRADYENHYVDVPVVQGKKYYLQITSWVISDTLNKNYNVYSRYLN